MSNLFTERALDIEIAGLLGWTNLEETDYYDDDYYGSNHVYAIRGTSPTGNTDILLPEWSADDGDALRLFYDLPERAAPLISMAQKSRQWSVSILTTTKDFNSRSERFSLAAATVFRDWKLSTLQPTEPDPRIVPPTAKGNAP